MTVATSGLIDSGLRRRYAVPTELDLAQQRGDFLQQIGAILEIRLEQRPRRVVVEPLEILRELAAALLVEPEHQRLDDRQRLADLLALRRDFSALEMAAGFHDAAQGRV